MNFPKDFVWGTASAAYAIEGAYRDDGKGLSVWDALAHKTGVIWGNHNGDTAADHYHLYKEDVALLKELGVKAYRFSISWPRVIPAGRGPLSNAGIGFYDKLVDELLAAGVDPYVTLFHWDFPYELYRKTGWLNADSPKWFGDYVHQVVQKLGDRVRNWITLSDPQRFVVLGHQIGSYAPGERASIQQVLVIAHQVLQAHGRAVMAIRAGTSVDCKVGVALTGLSYVPESDLQGDVDIARVAMFRILERNLWNNSWWMEPMLTGRYPQDGVRIFESMMPVVRTSELELINQPLDFLGLNLYSGNRVRLAEDGKPQVLLNSPNQPLTASGWAMMPEVMYWATKFFYEQYKLPIYITENGMSNIEWPSQDGKINDQLRIDFITRYLREMNRAMAAGVDIRGYFYWSFLDGFEWVEGMRQRCGLVYVNFENYKRVLKESGRWYRDVIQSNGAII